MNPFGIPPRDPAADPPESSIRQLWANSDALAFVVVEGRFELQRERTVCVNCGLDDPATIVRAIPEEEIMDNRESADDWPRCAECGEVIS